MEEKQIPFREILAKIMDVVCLKEEDKRTIQEQFKSLSTRQFILALMENINEKDTQTKEQLSKFIKTKNITNNSLNIALSSAISTLGKELIEVLYLESQIGVFSEIADEIIKNSNQEETQKIINILFQYKQLIQIFQ